MKIFILGDVQPKLKAAEMNDALTPSTSTKQLKKTIVLVGMMGSGKTAIGRALASKLSVAFLDSDAEIEEAAQASIAEIFERDGEQFFRKRESEVIDRLLSGDPCILSTGGGAFLAERNRASIARQGTAVWLNASLDLLWERVKHKDTRPLLRTPNPRETLENIYNERVPIYKLAGVHVDIQGGATIDETTANVLEHLYAQADIWGENE